MGISEIDEEWPPLERLIADRLAVTVLKREGAADQSRARLLLGAIKMTAASASNATTTRAATARIENALDRGAVSELASGIGPPFGVGRLLLVAKLGDLQTMAAIGARY